MVAEGDATRIREFFDELVGRRLFKAWNFCATWNFYFSKMPSGEDTGDDYCRLDLECPWRIVKENGILIGSEDYIESAEGKTDPSWRPSSSSSLQHQKLKELLGELRESAVYNIGPGLVVQSIEADNYGGFRIMLTGGYVLEAFPATNNLMQWAFQRPYGRSSLVLMYDKLNVTRGHQN